MQLYCWGNINSLRQGWSTCGMQKDLHGMRHSLLSPPQPASLYCEEYVCIHISDSIEIVYELPLLPNNSANVTFFANQEWCEVFTGYLLLGYQVGGDCANT
jgi:hypothetical protein